MIIASASASLVHVCVFVCWVYVCVCWVYVCVCVCVCVCVYVCLHVPVPVCVCIIHFHSSCVQTCIQSGKLQTAAMYLIIIQNLETPVVGKQVSATQQFVFSSFLQVGTTSFFYFCFQLATRLLETALEHSSWQVNRKSLTFVMAFYLFNYSFVMILCDFSRQ